MSRTITLAVCLVVFLCLAGCNAFGGTETAETPVVTPADVPTDAPLSDLPAGLSPGGITDSSALANAHAAALSNTSFTVQRTSTLTAANGTRLINVTSVQHVGATHSHSHWTTEVVVDGTYARFLLTKTPVKQIIGWFNGTYIFYQLQGPNGTEYLTLPFNRVDLTYRQQLRSYYLQAESTRVSAANGQVQLRVTMTPENKHHILMPAVNVTEQTVVLTLTKTGRVERYRVEYTGHLVNAPDTVVDGVTVVQFTALGETTVDRPEWVATARNASATRSR